MQPSRTLTATLLGVALALGVTAALAQTPMAPASTDSQESGTPTRAPSKRTAPPSFAADPAAGASATGEPMSGAGGEMKPHAKKHRHKKPANGKAKDAAAGAQSDGSDAATGMGNPQPGSAKPGQ
ncbi:hypothetical protein HF908_22780 (plasmid) [Ralstonia pseudosolanacearum]|uniref:hypothetical protein n=1 Tax=Ralstonia pseudosolanacearum TaxID=1310165 RepID=UPI0018682DA3|nr:hypothetical protein [Ralstonia pseudosolanacearum]QOK94237.1 hypothetical protein HF908_22780 [Ralstonia pseudosolanacearum]